MKCGYKTPTKLSPSKFKQEVSPTKHDLVSPTKHDLVSPTKHDLVSPTKHDLEPCKEQELSPKAGYSDSSVEHLSPSRVTIIEENRPVNNKENLLRRLSAVENNDLECSPLQDSGYSSILLNDSQSQDEEDFSSRITSVALFETPKQTTSQEKAAPVHPNTRSLPVLRFEEAVCSTLKKGLRSRPKVVFDTVEELVSREAFGLNNLIGKKMGLERMDILGELFLRDFKHLISKIFRHLSAIDLINVISVSTTWRKALQEDKLTYSIYEQCHKEICEREARKTEHTATRDSSQLRIPLYTVQKVASAACCISKKKNIKKNKPYSSNSRYSEFTEVGKSLINDQSLKVCRDCGSPAKYDSYQHRAICTRESCQLDFCTLCNCKFHFSKDCTTSRPQSHRSLSEPLPGSRKSKQNLRRL
ncbi:peptide chain release factor 1-like, mitochondrial isoform X1 [Hyla sarda]|uniref:peptide chain release factor 1-like, mitochondrial isoform X1 n=1 Tax=Hyla sarda TaxID=327740 RepID=UPI0024C3DD92|nr:peptide chain release factor 1-like, mitochondrial isoform X1 [Hyla sarda]XP_056423248.1 peptide chain release factor 1-like, mitochondrial isoform X1 [Hyla sarda]XP_056423249.1 peptide chain release factor 1-like, mitochondrial isoform X1 [Hyla sarda]XP_056423250.1 peptide chain release factor 1-like, mitochondrial isoform X1 [Hyla sarda]XP_056423251.1 peptide chain release factor 1-like, mitochondrial isoform X1 [Hyla sarda]